MTGVTVEGLAGLESMFQRAGPLKGRQIYQRLILPRTQSQTTSQDDQGKMIRGY